MRKLINSPKFWAITMGVVIGCVAYYFLGDGEGLSNTFPMLVVGAYSSVAVVDKVKDVASAVTINKQKPQQ